MSHYASPYTPQYAAAAYSQQQYAPYPQQYVQPQYPMVPRIGQLAPAQPGGAVLAPGTMIASSPLQPAWWKQSLGTTGIPYWAAALTLAGLTTVGVMWSRGRKSGNGGGRSAARRDPQRKSSGGLMNLLGGQSSGSRSSGTKRSNATKRSASSGRFGAMRPGGSTGTSATASSAMPIARDPARGSRRKKRSGGSRRRKASRSRGRGRASKRG